MCVCGSVHCLPCLPSLTDSTTRSLLPQPWWDYTFMLCHSGSELSLSKLLAWFGVSWLSGWVFDICLPPVGTCWAHRRCVEWSLGVCQMEEPALVNVDKAVVSGSTEVRRGDQRSCLSWGPLGLDRRGGSTQAWALAPYDQNWGPLGRA